MVLEEHRRRSLAKAVTYRLVILVLDVTAIYMFTGRFDIALGFMMVSNIYTSVAYYVHERIWNKIGWGKTKQTPSANI